MSCSFNEGNTYYDIKQNKVYSKFPKEEFYVSPDPVAGLYVRYERHAVGRALLRCHRAVRNYLKHLAKLSKLTKLCTCYALVCAVDNLG